MLGRKVEVIIMDSAAAAPTHHTPPGLDACEMLTVKNGRVTLDKKKRQRSQVPRR